MSDKVRYFTLEEFKNGKARDAIVAPAVRGAMERNAKANELGPGGDPRLQASQQINMERATDTGLAMAPTAAGIVGGPLAGAAVGGLSSLAQGHGPVRAAVDTALGGLTGGGLRLLMGGKAAAGAAAPTVGAIMSEAAPAAESVAAKAGAPTVSTLMSEGAEAAKPFVKTIEPLTPASVLEKVAKLKEMGLSRGQIIASLKETHGLKESAATKVLKLIEEAGH